MASLLDKLAKTPPVPVSMRVFAVDPGLEVLGWACVTIHATKPLMEEPRFEDIDFGLLDAEAPQGSRDMIKAQAMVSAVMRWLRLYARGSALVVVEGQQVYYKDDEGRDRVVAKANDLLRLAQVMGAVQMLAALEAVPCTLTPLPAEWKGQTDKGAMHQEASRVLGSRLVRAHQLGRGVPPMPYYGTLKISELPKRMHHGLDALCMAMIMGERKLRQDTV